MWESAEGAAPWPSARWTGHVFSAPAAQVRTEGVFPLVTYPTVQFLDGRGANRPWLQELPDPVTQITWGNWVEIHHETATRMGIEKGDLLYLKSSHGSIVVPAFPYEGVHRGLLAMPMGQGHTAYGLFADGQPGNPAELLSPDPDGSGGVA